MLSIEGSEYDVIISDFDGTLAGSDKIIPEEVKKAIRRLNDVNVKFLLASGRNFHGIVEDACRELDLTSPQITAGGAEIVDPVTRRVLSAEYISDEDAQSLFNLLLEKGIDFWVEKDFTIYTKRKEEHSSLGPSVYKDFQDLVFINIPKIGILPVSDMRVGEELERELAEKYKRLHITRSFSPVARAWDITGAMGNKQEAVLKISRILEVPTSRIIGIGDGYNDFPLLEAVGYKVAMGNAHEELKQIADRVVPPYQANGVAAFINSLLT